MPLRPSDRAFERRQRAAADRELAETVRGAVNESRARVQENVARARLYDARLKSGTVEAAGGCAATEPVDAFPRRNGGDAPDHLPPSGSGSAAVGDRRIPEPPKKPKRFYCDVCKRKTPCTLCRTRIHGQRAVRLAEREKPDVPKAGTSA